MRAGVVVLVARVALWTGGTRVAHRAAKGTARTLPAGELERLPWAVRAASRCIPGANCLPQALALQALLECGGRPCRVEIGVAKEDIFEAHAWVVCGDRIVLGGSGAARFHCVATLD